MKDYYDILDVPLNASVEQIKSRYKQLVRIYHPDRFSNALDKVYAEHKLKQVNEAYAFLTSDTEGMTLFNTIAVPPEPVVEPAVLDFGVLHPGDQQILRFEVSNSGGPASGVTFVCSEENSWFRVSNGRRLDPAKTLPMVFEVVADIRPNYPAQHYGGWIEISMGGVKTRVQLTAEVQEGQASSTFQMPSFQLPAWQLPTWRLPSLQMRYRLVALIGIFCLIALFLNSRFPQSIVNLINDIRVTQSALLVSAASEPEATATPLPPTAPAPTLTQAPSPVATLAVVTRVVESLATEAITPPTAPPSPVPAAELVSPAQERAALPASDEQLPPGAAEATITALTQGIMTETVVSAVTPAMTPTTVPPTTVPPTATPLATATPLPTPTSIPATATPIPPPTATPLPASTATPLPTATSTVPPTATVLPLGGLYEILLADGSARQALTLEIPLDRTVNVRFSWDIRSPAVAVLVGGTRLPAVGRSIDNAWVQVALPDGQLGWIFTEVISVDFGQIEQLPPTLAPQWP